MENRAEKMLFSNPFQRNGGGASRLGGKAGRSRRRVFAAAALRTCCEEQRRTPALAGKSGQKETLCFLLAIWVVPRISPSHWERADLFFCAGEMP